MRERFGNWGAGLSEADFACALAALGTVGNGEDSWTADRLASEIRDRLEDGQAQWRFDPRRLSLNAGVLAEAWRLFLDSGGVGVGIRLSRLLLQVQKLDPVWLRDRLRHPEVHAGSVEIVHAFGLEDEIDSYVPEREPGTRSYSFELPDDEVFTVRGRGTVVLGPESHRRSELKPTSPARYLQAQIHSLANPAKPRPIQSALRPGGSYTAVIRVGVPDALWKHVSQPIQLPDESREHELTVVFVEPRVSPEPQVRTLRLPATGSSEPVTFSFRAPEGGSISARIIVLHANRVLQTGLLRAPVGSGKWTFELDATPRAVLEGLEHRGQFDAAMIVDQDGRAVAAADDTVVPLTLDEGRLRALTEFFGSQISDITNDPERYESLQSAGSRELLRRLAGMGAQVHRQLRESTGLSRFEQARRIHITSANAGSFLPVELIYRFDPPSRDAQICPHALASLESGNCSGACAADKTETICPLGFWGLSRVIERHGPNTDGQEGRFEIRAEPCRPRSLLPLSGSALLAASDKTSIVKKDAVTELLRKLETRGPAALAKTWKEWEQHVAKDLPSLLVLLPHHERKGGLEVLEIGAGDFLESIEIRSRLVRREPDGPHPIVLLMGCETQLAEVSFENFATLFRSWGASVVVSTIASILGRHASPATATLVELLDQMADGESTFGDVMLRLRQKLVAQATPMALGLTSYGDADWILTRKEA